MPEQVTKPPALWYIPKCFWVIEACVCGKHRLYYSFNEPKECHDHKNQGNGNKHDNDCCCCVKFTDWRNSTEVKVCGDHVVTKYCVGPIVIAQIFKELTPEIFEVIEAM